MPERKPVDLLPPADLTDLAAQWSAVPPISTAQLHLWIRRAGLRATDVLVARLIIDLQRELSETRDARDLAVAHDTQPYPTAWAYEQACAALEKHRQRAEAAETELATLRAEASR